jgi:hypothetical protein
MLIRELLARPVYLSTSPHRKLIRNARINDNGGSETAKGFRGEFPAAWWQVDDTPRFREIGERERQLSARRGIAELPHVYNAVAGRQCYSPFYDRNCRRYWDG